MSTQKNLFSTDLISPEVQASLPKGYTLRPLSIDDYELGFFEVLSVFEDIGNLSKDQFLERFNYMRARNDEYFIIVIISPENRIVGTGTIFVERKFIFNAGLVGHIEDVAIDKNHQGKHFGSSIVQALKYIGIKTGCIKAILDCSVENISFYEKCGLQNRGIEMSCDFDTR
ncbi:glucosamine 6-phosphate N-acetyltransferase [Rhizophagus irregularis]|uniref:Glucosamine 6-phosphate N-acetyltransferase n=3 Tax=Rhizophagus irregularis TaxID=588596 RepID=A0A2I1GGG5_9GLOM|nr:glucosamine 6-phosphate N-acetyltransferase [Rhizophagus irregularis DAOM 181602=DAOM 197198]EXX50204.1 glucosamine 6-phosphate N-acetyltransferase [Rhizophagus irregularis DAOM 197198w]PKC05628.1 glucosamine 6-phosphate N-acetyltransferase [Rhizophagus irregularis]PKC62574.1 glucosamine 6-phosphate N-acetyltransferase [Rhizophagus irregularis]PKK71040.1 glucosamine 6-phosphate N-acetyltransferase [Rhizophagus irregularis]PKY25783.1 glucosamine 6-phosphate N-acetyltransferase [Rhizophagus i|eukprot:XP_025184623.1 glucosamine 6-phosphate N-acetyltransferase [Rhizophagus irregularis DAOM 181602=DAOM 197198]